MFSRYVAALILTPWFALNADAAEWKYNKLEELLKKKTSPPLANRSRAKKSKKKSKRDDFFFFDDKQRSKGNKGRSSQRRPVPGETAVAGIAQDWFGRFASAAFGSRLGDLNGLLTGPSQRPNDVRPIADKAIARRDTYVIQLKIGAGTDKEMKRLNIELDKLLAKYGLRITRSIGRLGLIYCESIAPSGRSRSVGKQTLSGILEPKIIKDLRKEPIVASAFVSTTVAPQGLPRRSSTEVRHRGQIFRWSWRRNVLQDGNWGLKTIRMPPVWTILERSRQSGGSGARVKLGFVDVGFSEHRDLQLNPVGRAFGGRLGGIRACDSGHGTHVAGIAGAFHDNGTGIDGIYPDGDIDAVTFETTLLDDLGSDNLDEIWENRVAMFFDVLESTYQYVTERIDADSRLRVVNISLAYNWLSQDVLEGKSPEEIASLRLHLASQALAVRTLASLAKNQVLFVVPAGNDSDGLTKPLDAEWASPFTWAGLNMDAENILVVEAFDRERKRASFSNRGGHVSAPGVGIMSTLAASPRSYGLCSGTSQAAPHVSALAALLFELSPESRPAEVASIIKNTSTVARDATSAPQIDALAAVLEASPSSARLLLDLNGDDRVDRADLVVFRDRYVMLHQLRSGLVSASFDMNGDGAVDDAELDWPLVDFNGNGRVDIETYAASGLIPSRSSDLDMFALSWPSEEETFQTVVDGLGLSDPAGLQHSTIVIGERSNSGSPLAASSSSTRDKVSRAMSRLQSDKPGVSAQIDRRTGLPRSIRGLSKQTNEGDLTASARARTAVGSAAVPAIVRKFFSTGGIGASIFPTVNPKAGIEVTRVRDDPDFKGQFVADVTQNVDGIPIFGSSGRVIVEPGGDITELTASFSRTDIASTTPSVAKVDAENAAREKLDELLKGRSQFERLQAPTPYPWKAAATSRLVIYDPALAGASAAGGVSRLAWLVQIQDFHLFVDAENRSVLDFYRDERSFVLRKVYDLNGDQSFPGHLVIDEEGGTSSGRLHGDARRAFNNSIRARDYFFVQFGRRGVERRATDGRSGALTASVSATDATSFEAYVRYGGIANAFWCSAASVVCPKKDVMVYGPGFAGALDIVGHEYGHGVVAHEANLVYKDEAGAINEAIADIFGTLIEFYHHPDTANWLIGEQLPDHSRQTPMRSLSDPTFAQTSGTLTFVKSEAYSVLNRGQPDHYAAYVDRKDPICKSTGDFWNGCVHFNSGIINKFAYLVAEGGTHRNIVVKGIGQNKLGRIVYRALTTSLNAGSSMADAATGFWRACDDLEKAQVLDFEADDCTQVEQALIAVGLFSN